VKEKGTEIKAAKGKLGILIPGIGAVSTTLMAGVELIRKGHSKAFGSVSQMGTIRLGKRTEDRTPLIKDFVPLAGLNDIIFGGWDIFEDNAYEAAQKAQVLSKDDLEKVVRISWIWPHS
jgi:myo-inositol-1-phosphate synthase